MLRQILRKQLLSAYLGSTVKHDNYEFKRGIYFALRTFPPPPLRSIFFPNVPKCVEPKKMRF